MKLKAGMESGKAETGKAETRNDVMNNLHLHTALSHLSISAMHSHFSSLAIYTLMYMY